LGQNRGQSNLLNCLQQTLKLPGFSLHQVADESRHSAHGLAQRQVCLYVVIIESMDNKIK